MPTIAEMWYQIRDSLESYAKKYEDPTYHKPIIANAFRDFLNAMHENMTYREFYDHFITIRGLDNKEFTVADLPHFVALKDLMTKYMLARREAGDGLDATTKAAAPQVALTPQATSEHVTYDVVYRYSDDKKNGGDVQHEIRVYRDETQKKMNGQYLNGTKVFMKADDLKGSGREPSQCVTITRTHNVPLNISENQMNYVVKYPDHSFSYVKGITLASCVLMWRDLSYWQFEDANEKYEIECQDDVDPLRPEIRNYGVGGVDAQAVYQLWQLPPPDMVQIYYFNDKKHYTNISDKQGEKQPQLRWALRGAIQKGGDMTAEDVNKIRRQWEDKKQKCAEYIATTRVGPNSYYEWNPWDLTRDWHAKIYNPQSIEMGVLLQRLGAMTKV
jgi:hypothetical protein